MLKLKELARKQKKRADWVDALRLSDTPAHSLMYVYWRNKYQVLSKIVSRLIVILEVYFLQLKFQLSLISPLVLALMTIFLFQDIIQALLKSLRLRIIALQAEDDDISEISKILSLYTSAGILLACVGCFLISLVSWILGGGLISSAMITAWFLIFPFYIIANAAWVFVYTRRRLRTNFYVLAILRVYPLIFVALFSDFLGLFSYFLGYLVCNLGQNYYLYQNTVPVLQYQKTSLSFRPYFRRPFHALLLFYKDLKNEGLFGNVLAGLPFCIHKFSLFLILYLHNFGQAMTYFICYNLIELFAYPAYRASRSYLMDYYLALKNHNLIFAQEFRRKSDFSLQVVLALVSLILLSGLFALLYSFGILELKIVRFGPYLIALAMLTSVYRVKLLQMEVSGSERRLALSTTALYIFLLLPLQAWLILFQYANLQFVFLVEIVVLGLLVAIMVFKGSFKYEADIVPLLQPRAGRSEDIPLDNLIYRSGSINADDTKLVLITINKLYKGQRAQQDLLSKVTSELSVFFCAKVSKRRYLLAAPENLNQQGQIDEIILARFAFHLKVDGVINAAQFTPEWLLGLTRSSTTHIMEEIKHEARTLKDSDARDVSKMLEPLGLKDRPFVYMTKSRIWKGNEASVDFMQSAYLACQRRDERYAIVPQAIPGVLIFRISDRERLFVSVVEKTPRAVLIEEFLSVCRFEYILKDLLLGKSRTAA